MSRAKWTEAEAAGAAKEADRMSVTAAGYAKARSEIIGLFGWNAGVIESAFRNFPENIRFGEFFRTDYNWIGER